MTSNRVESPVPRQVSLKCRLPLLPVLLFAGIFTYPKSVEAGSERRDDIIAGTLACFHHDNETNTSLVCLEFNVAESLEFGNDDYITLWSNEIFEGNHNAVVLTRITDYSGLFKVSASSLADAPDVPNLHVIGGQTRRDAGFIIQQSQNNFIVLWCSSSGSISGIDSGDICGSVCSGDVLIAWCWSSGDIHNGGGIAGRTLAEQAELVL